MGNSFSRNFRIRNEPNRSPKIDMTIGIPALFILGAGVLVALAWIFWMGFIVGRGQNPETQLENIAGIIQGTKQAALERQGLQSPDQKKESTPTESENAKQEKPGDSSASTPPTNGTPSSAEKASGTGVAQPAAPSPALPSTPQPVQATDASQGPTIIYRLATLKNMQAAQQEQKRLDAKGIKSQIVKAGKVFVLRQSIRGDKENAEYKQKLKAAGVKAVSSPQKKKP